MLSILKAVQQRGKPPAYYKAKAVLSFPWEESLGFNFCPRKGLFFATGVRRIPGEGVALAVAEARSIIEVHRMLAHRSEEIMSQTAEAFGIATTGQWGSCKARLQIKAKRQTVRWIDGRDKTGIDGVGNENVGAKTGKYE